MFRVGDLVVGRVGSSNDYSITNENTLCIVKVVYGTTMKVKTVATILSQQYTGEVDMNRFEPCTYNQFMERYPAAHLCYDFTAEDLCAIKATEENKEANMLVMDKTKFGNHILTEEERTALREEIVELLEEYSYSPTDRGVNKVIDEWIANKGWLINLFKKHPKYNGKFQIVFDSDYDRVCDKDAIGRFTNYLSNKSYDAMTEFQLGKHSFHEVKRYYEILEGVVSHMRDIEYLGYSDVTVRGRNYEDTLKEYDKWYKKYRAYRNLKDRGEIVITLGHAYTRDSYTKCQKIRNLSDFLYNYYEHTATDELVRKVNSEFPEVKAVVGQKTTRIVNKLCKLTGIDKMEDYNREFAKYADAINPLTIKRFTVLSVHPVDYLTMSFGNSWASCHTIDKHNTRNMPNSYSGGYSSGTMSYMLDGSSFVFYTVDASYDGDEFELQDKINRNMFHIGEDKLIQARVYPQSSDGENGIYKQIREICQKVVADCLDIPNLWTNEKGANVCYELTSSYGTHYHDYTNFDSCNVSFIKSDTKNRNRIRIGHDPICPSCGESHRYQESVECEGCYTDEIRCAECDCLCDQDDMHFINGRWYCEDCCFYCDYHERWEVGSEDDMIYVRNLGTCCEDSANMDDIVWCDCCDNYVFTGGIDIHTEDGHTFCCTSCAEVANYAETSEGKWYPVEEVHYCETCGRNVHTSEWNEETERCTHCANNEEEA